MARSTAFTLIELLIVVAIIAILAAIAVPNFLEAQTRSKVARSKNDLRVLANAATLYFNDNRAMPPDNIPGEFDVDALRRLTTPIAYITSVPQTPFSPDSRAGMATQPQAYEYWAGWWDGSRFNYDTGAEETGIYCRFTTIGPDGERENYGTFTRNMWPISIATKDPGFINIVYDPTNGTISDGDIIGSNRGLEPQG